MAEKASIKLIPIGGLDMDSEPSRVANSDYPLAYNMRNSVSYANQAGVPVNMKGNTLVAYVLGTATYECIGSLEDKQDSIFYFVWASDGNHRILRYYPNNTQNNPLGEIQLITQFNFGWNVSEHITGIDFIDQKILNWTDSVQPRTINVVKANLTNKFKSWDVTLPVSESGSYNVTITILSNTGAFITSQAIAVSGTRAQKFQSLATVINNGNLNNYISAVPCDCSMTITETAVNSYQILFSLPKYWVVPENWYGTQLRNQYFDACYYPPGESPITEYGQNSQVLTNFVKNRVLFFRTGYMGRDYQISKTSPVSTIAVNNQVCNQGEYDLFNFIDVNVNDPALLDPNTFVIIKKVTVYVQEHNTGVWSKVFDFPYCDLYDIVNGNTVFHYKFYGNEQVYSVPAVQINAQYDNLPIKANGQKFAENKISYAGVTEGYDAPKCVEASIIPSFGEINQQEFAIITFNVRICNPSFNGTESSPTKGNTNGGGVSKMPYQVGFSKSLNYGPQTQNDGSCITPSNKAGCIVTQPNANYPCWGGCDEAGIATNQQSGYEQPLPLGGFLIYAAGTQFYGISRQVNLGGLAIDQYGSFVLANGGGQQLLNYLFDSFDVTAPGYSPNSGDIYSVVQLKVPLGKHIIRAASHCCSVGDVLQKGTIYDITQGLFGLTSTNVFRINDPNGNWIGDTEVEINVTQNAFFGEILIADRMVYNIGSGNTESLQRNVFGFAMDVQLFEVLNQTAKCQGLERQTAHINIFGVDNYTYTDHNGYYFFMFTAGKTVTSITMELLGTNGQVLTKTTDPKYYGDAGQVYDNVILGSNYIQFNNNQTWQQATANGISNTLGPYLTAVIAQTLVFSNPYASGYAHLQHGNPGQYYNVLGQTVSVVQGSVDVSQVVREVLLLLTNSQYRLSFSTVVTGEFVDNNGNPVCCTTAVLNYNGRPGVSANDGTFTVLAYAEGRLPLNYGPPAGSWNPVTALNIGPPATLQGFLIFESGDCLAVYSQNPLYINIAPFNANIGTTPPPYSETAWYSVGDILCDLFNTFVKAPKRGTAYDFVLRFQDSAGRQSSCVRAVSDFYIPFFSEDWNKYFPSLFPVGTFSGGYPILNWALPANFQVPEWAATMQWLRTKNKNQSAFLQWVLNEVTYVIQADNNGAAVTTAYDLFNATQIWISIENLLTFKSQNPESPIQWQYKIGQRIRFISDQNGNQFTKYVDVEVLGLSPDGTSYIIQNINTLGQIMTGWLVELYNPAEVVQDAIYYECGAVVPCTNPGNSANTLSTFNGTFTWGDTFWYQRNFPLNNTTDIVVIGYTLFFIESSSVSDLYESNDQDIGRPGVIDISFRQIYKYNVFRVSDEYLPDTGINGLSSFTDVDDVELGREFGAILKLITTGFVIGAVCQNKFVSNYLGAVEGAKPDGSLSIASQQGFINDSRPLLGDYGTQHPATVVEKDGHVWGADFLRGIVWEYDDNGLKEIQKAKVQNFFRQFMALGVFDAVAGFDPFYNEYILSAWVNQNNQGVFFGSGIPAQGVPFSYGFNISGTTFPIGTVANITFIDAVTGETITVQGTVSIVGGQTTWFILPPGTYNLNPFNGAKQPTIAKFVTRGQGYTIAYQKDKKRWTTFYNYLPESMCGVGNNFVSWKGGQLYLHDTGPINTFYGVFYPWLLTIIATQAELKDQPIKVWAAVRYEQIEYGPPFVGAPSGNRLFNWAIPVITNEINQLSRLVKGAFKKFEEWWHSDMRKDLNTTSVINPIVNGREMRSQNLVLQMQNDSTNKVELRGVSVAFQESPGNTK